MIADEFCNNQFWWKIIGSSLRLEREGDFPTRSLFFLSAGVEISWPEQAGMVFIDQDQVWILESRGADASRRLREVAGRMKLSR
jgi:hypothetical protein